jgi:phage terminase large subunit-like protein
MFQPPTPLDIRVNHQLVGQATDAVTAHEINERLDVMANWMVGEDATRQSLAWAEWLKIARPDQLPPQFDANWREWKIQGDRGSGKTTAAAQFIASQTDDPELRVHIMAKTRELARHHARTLAELCSARSGMGVYGPHKLPDGGLISCYSVDQTDNLRGVGTKSTIFWLDELIFLPKDISVGKFHSFTKEILRRNCRVIWSG